MNFRKMAALSIMGLVLVGGSARLACAQEFQDPQGPPRQGGQPQPPRPQDQISPQEIQSMLDAMAVMEAEKFLTLTPEQFPVFVQRLKRLQEARVNQIRRRGRAMVELRGMANPQNGHADDATIEGKLRELDAIEVEARTAVGKALEAIDQMLSVKQRARFRLLEDNLEKRKLDFLAKVRRGAV